MTGPPAEPLKSLRCSTRAPLGNPRVFKASSRLVDCRCQLSEDPPKKPDPCTELPPSFGIKFRRTPPADDSADTPLVWYVASAMRALSMLQYSEKQMTISRARRNTKRAKRSSEAGAARSTATKRGVRCGLWKRRRERLNGRSR